MYETLIGMRSWLYIAINIYKTVQNSANSLTGQTSQKNLMDDTEIFGKTSMEFFLMDPQNENRSREPS